MISSITVPARRVLLASHGDRGPPLRHTTESEILTRDIHLDEQSFKRCLKSDEPGKQIESDIKKTRALLVSGTPSFAVGRIDATGKVEVDNFITGSQQFDVFRKDIEGALTKKHSPS